MVSVGLVRVRYKVSFRVRVRINIKLLVKNFIHLYSADGATESFDHHENSLYALSHTTVVRIAPAFCKLRSAFCKLRRFTNHAQQQYTLCPKKRSHFYFFNNSVRW